MTPISEALGVKCPICDAPPGEWCDGPPVSASRFIHQNRLRFASRKRDRSNNMNRIDRQIAQAERDRERAERRLELLRNIPEEPDYDTNVIYFEKQFRPGAQTYSYAAIKVNGYWYTTGPQGGGEPRTWEDLMVWLGVGAEIWFATNYERLGG